MLLQNKNAVIYGGGGAIGGAVARAFAREGAKIFLAGRTLAKLGAVAREISTAGGAVETAQVDALDEQAVEKHLEAVINQAGRIDISFNAVGFNEIQGIPLIDLSLEDFIFPITGLEQDCVPDEQGCSSSHGKTGGGSDFNDQRSGGTRGLIRRLRCRLRCDLGDFPNSGGGGRAARRSDPLPPAECGARVDGASKIHCSTRQRERRRGTGVSGLDGEWNPAPATAYTGGSRRRRVVRGVGSSPDNDGNHRQAQLRRGG
jgi:hypothetical protein